MKQNRQAEYHPKDKDLRCVSRPNGLWAVQRDTFRSQIDVRSPRQDYWVDLFGASALSYEQAKARMAAEGPSNA